jgi:hypothetical protein
MDEQVNAQVQHSTLVPELLARTNYISTLPARLADRYRERPHMFELPFETRGLRCRDMAASQSGRSGAHVVA